MRKKKFSKLVGVLLTDETHELLVKVTDEAEQTLSEYIREIIENRLSKIKIEGRTTNE
jgi:predicted DNA-binding protein